jgi:hypothetical protein
MRDSSDPPSLRMSLERNPYRESVASTKAAVWGTRTTARTMILHKKYYEFFELPLTELAW